MGHLFNLQHAHSSVPSAYSIAVQLQQVTNLNHDGENAKYGTNLDDTNYSVYVLLNFALTFEKASYTYIQHNKGLS